MRVLCILRVIFVSSSAGGRNLVRLLTCKMTLCVLLSGIGIGVTIASKCFWIGAPSEVVVVTGMQVARKLHPGQGVILRFAPLDLENLQGT